MTVFNPKPLRSAATLLGIALAIHTIIRVGFVVANFHLVNRGSFGELVLAIVHGIRFDLSVILLWQSPWILLFILPVARWSGWGGATFRTRVIAARHAFSVLWVVVSMGLAIGLDLMDVGYYPFTGRRSTMDVFSLTADIQAQVGQIAGQYWYLFLGGFAVLGVMVRVAWVLVPRADFVVEAGLARPLLQGLALLALCVFLVRGGWQVKPLDVPHALLFSSPVLADVTTNTPFYMSKSLGRAPVRAAKFFATDDEVMRLVRSPEPARGWSSPRRDNVVVILLESFGSEYSALFGGAAGQGYMPYLDSLALKGRWFPHAYANGRRSIEAVSSVLAGVPSLMDEPLITSIYKGNAINGLGSILQRQGYRTMFFHGGQNGTMFFDVFARLAGIEEYFGMSEYPGRGDFDGHWGVFDEPFLLFSAETMSMGKSPFFATIFSLSSHNPYPIPEKYKDQFPGGTLKIHKSIQYADHALKTFMDQAAKAPWYKDTLFVITADHTATNERAEFSQDLGLFQVPMILFHGGDSALLGRDDRLAQHVDIPWTVLDFLGVDGSAPESRLPLFGRSLFQPGFRGRVVNHTSGTYWYATDQGVLRARLDFEGGRGALLQSRSLPPVIDSSETNGATSEESLLLELKAQIQLFNDIGMRRNMILSQ